MGKGRINCVRGVRKHLRLCESVLDLQAEEESFANEV